MKWFCAVNEAGYGFENYAQLLKVAVWSALRNTSLVPYLLYDGGENALTEWLRARGVTIIPRRTFLYDHLARIAKERDNTGVLEVGAGAFLRTELPRLSSEMNLDDDYVLYTDLDVVFLEDVVGYFQSKTPRYFAVAPESRLGDYAIMNTGVMLMNLKNLRKQDEKFREFMVQSISTLVSEAWDQTAYHQFYQRRWLKPRWDRLPSEYNWKPYWGDCTGAKIIHFHGPKPHQREMLLSGATPVQFRPLLPLIGGKYQELSRLWDNLLEEAEESNPADLVGTSHAR